MIREYQQALRTLPEELRELLPSSDEIIATQGRLLLEQYLEMLIEDKHSIAHHGDAVQQLEAERAHDLAGRTVHLFLRAYQKLPE